MAFGQTPGQYPYPGAAQGFPAPPGAPQRGGRMIGFGIALLAYVALELVLLVSDVVDAGPGMIGTVFGIGSDYAYGPLGFYPTDLGIVVVLVVCAVGAFTGRGWSRFAALPVIAVFAFGTLTQLLTQLTAHDMRGMFSSAWYTYLNLLAIAELLLAVVVILVGALSGREPSRRPVLPQQPYYGAPQMPPPPAGYGQQPPTHPMTQVSPPPQAPQAPQQPGYGYPPPPAQPPAGPNSY